MKPVVSMLFIVLFAAQVFAADIQSAFEALKGEAVDYEPTGQICEEVARLQFAEKYHPDQFIITGGLEYSYQKRTLGELDLLVIDKNSHEVIVVGEVKCWKSLKGAIDKAHEQRNRFLNTIKRVGTGIVFDAEDEQTYEVSQFKNTQYISIAPLGATEAGFDVELEYTLRELMQLRNLLLRCQTQGQCPRPIVKHPKTF